MRYLRNFVLDCQDPDALAAFWSAALGYRRASANGQYTVLAPTDREFPRLILQRVPEPKVGKNRAHLDIGTDDRAAEVERLVGLGARVLRVVDDEGFTVLADPAGNEFCVVG